MVLRILVQLKAALVKLLEMVVIILFAVLFLDVLWGVISRASGGLVVRLYDMGYEPWWFLPRGQSQWTEEVAINLLMWVSLLGAAVAYGAKSHLGVDYFVNKLHPEAQKVAEIAVNAIVGLFAIVVLIVGGYWLVSATFSANVILPALQIKAGYMYLAVPVSGVFILLFCAENIVEIIFGKHAEQSASDDIVSQEHSRPDTVKMEDR